jgi:hypothetical protein
MRTLSRDPFARTETVRANYYNAGACSWCGQRGPERVGPRYLYQYGTVRDDRPGSVNWHRGVFCSKGCHDAYHGS